MVLYVCAKRNGTCANGGEELKQTHWKICIFAQRKLHGIFPIVNRIHFVNGFYSFSSTFEKTFYAVYTVQCTQSNSTTLQIYREHWLFWGFVMFLLPLRLISEILGWPQPVVNSNVKFHCYEDSIYAHIACVWWEYGICEVHLKGMLLDGIDHEVAIYLVKILGNFWKLLLFLDW